MPELPEVESVRKIMESVLVGSKITNAEFVSDDIVFKGYEPEYLKNLVLNQSPTKIGRHGKFWWIELPEGKSLVGHLGMAGWIREIGEPTIRLREHGNAPLVDESGRLRFLKWQFDTDKNRSVAMTDQRRFAQMWISDDPLQDPRIKRLGPDVYNTPLDPAWLNNVLRKRTAAIKAVLLDQKVFCGVGNWIADEVLYQAHIAPIRPASELSNLEIESILDSLSSILKTAVDVGADKEQFPSSWLFHTRWGGSKGDELIDGQLIRRDTIGGRTTAWVPSIQK